jgi:hypothetical protein
MFTFYLKYLQIYNSLIRDVIIKQLLVRHLHTIPTQYGTGTYVISVPEDILDQTRVAETDSNLVRDPDPYLMAP